MFKLSLVTSERVIYEGDISSITAPGSIGYLGLLTNHAPIITALQPGKLTFRDSSGREIVLAVSGGFLENSNNKCTVLADAAEFADKIDVERAKAALERARTRLHGKTVDIDIPRARNAYQRAQNRIAIASRE